MNSIHSKAVIAAMYLLISIPCFAGMNRWTTNGPEGASVVSLVTDPTNRIIYALSERGAVFRSESDGEPHWEPIATNLVGTMITAVAVDAMNPATLYAGTSTGQLYRSRDVGTQWTPVSKPPTGAISAIAIDAPRSRMYLSTNSGLLISDDDARSWRLVADYGRGPVVVAPDSVVYATHVSSALHVSTDGGRNWKTTALPTIIGLAVDQQTSTVYAAQREIVWASNDAGRTWRALPLLPGHVVSIHTADRRLYAVIDNGPDTYGDGLYNGLYEYTETGPRWHRSGPSAVTTLAFVSSSPARIYLGTKTGILIGVDAGTDWKESNKGLTTAPVSDVATLRDETAFATTHSGLFRTRDGGDSWSRVAGVEERLVNVATNGQKAVYVSGHKGIKRSGDSGETWEIVNSSLPTALAVTPTSPETIYAAWSNSFSKSSDGGRTWVGLATYGNGLTFDYGWFYYGVAPTVLETDHENPSVAYLGYEPGLAKTENSAATWRDLLKTKYPDLVRAVAGQGRIVHASLSHGIVTSLDGGGSWSSPQLADERVSAIAIDPIREWRGYAGTFSGRVYRSDDSGATWILFSEGLQGAAVHRLAINDAGNRIYAATSGGMFVNQVAPTLTFDPLPEDPLRLPQLMRQILSNLPGATDGTAAFVMPAVGTVAGSQGSVFRTDVTLANNRAVEQEVMVAWLPQANFAAAAVPMFRLKLPAFANDSGGTLAIADIADELGLEGLGSMIVFAINSAGEADAAADIDGFARVRSASPCGSGSVSQSLSAVSVQSFAPHRSGRALGLRHESGYRTNVGVVNLSNATREFTVVVDGQRRQERFTISVPPFSSRQSAVPDHEYGPIAITVTSSGSDPWTAYASSVDNASGDAWASLTEVLRER